MKSNYTVIYLIIVGLMFSCSSRSGDYIKVDFSDTDNSRFNYEFKYIIRDSSGVILENKELKLNLLSKAKIYFPEYSNFIDLQITSENDIDRYGAGSYVYADLNPLLITKGVHNFHIVSVSNYSINHDDEDLIIKIENKKNNEYNFISIYDSEKRKVSEYIVNRNITTVKLKDLQSTGIYSEKNGFKTDFAIILFGENYTFIDGNTYTVRVNAGKVNSYKALRAYNNPQQLAYEFIY